MVARAHFGSIAVAHLEISVDAPLYRWMREHGPLHIPDVQEQKHVLTVDSASGWRTFLSVPLRQQGELIGSLFTRRLEVRPFTQAQIKLLETFASAGSYRLRKRPFVSGAHGIIGAADCNERNLGRHCQLTDGYPTCS